jgi:HSP20 family protein
MGLVRWNPARDLRVLEDEMERLFEGAWHARGELPAAAPVRAWRPGADIRETAGDLYVRIDLPGVDPKDVKVSLFEDTLTVRGERREEKKDEDVKWHRVERFHGEFERSFRIDASVQGDKVAASFKDGVLEIRIPKAESAKPREIPVQTAGN